jgi:hypothetical protein
MSLLPPAEEARRSISSPEGVRRRPAHKGPGYVVYHPNSTIFTRVRIDGEKNPMKFKLFCVVFFALNALFFLACVTMLILRPVTRGGR